MRIMAVGTEYPFFLYGVVAWEVEPGLYILMAFKTYPERIPWPDYEVGAGMNVMTVGTGYIVN